MVSNGMKYRSIPNSDAYMVGNILVIRRGYGCNFTAGLVVAQRQINGKEEVLVTNLVSALIYSFSTFAVLSCKYFIVLFLINFVYWIRAIA